MYNSTPHFLHFFNAPLGQYTPANPDAELFASLIDPNRIDDGSLWIGDTAVKVMNELGYTVTKRNKGVSVRFAETIKV